MEQDLRDYWYCNRSLNNATRNPRSDIIFANLINLLNPTNYGSDK
jgi:hypothetical protein